MTATSTRTALAALAATFAVAVAPAATHAAASPATKGDSPAVTKKTQTAKRAARPGTTARPNVTTTTVVKLTATAPAGSSKELQNLCGVYTDLLQQDEAQIDAAGEAGDIEAIEQASETLANDRAHAEADGCIVQ